MAKRVTIHTPIEYDNACVHLYLKENFADLKVVFEKARPMFGSRPIPDYIYGLMLCHKGLENDGLNIIHTCIKAYEPFQYFDYIACRHKSIGTLTEAQISHLRLQAFLEASNSKNFIVSYPKCGRTWLRFMLGTYLHAPEVTENVLDVFGSSLKRADIPSTFITHDDYPHTYSWTDHSQDKRAYQDRRVLFLARDPRDVVVSNFFQYTKREDSAFSSQADTSSMKAFVRGDVGGLKSIISFYNIWSSNTHVPAEFLLQTYESYKANAHDAFQKALKFLHWPENPNADVHEIIKNAGFEKMHALEKNNTFKSGRLTAKDTTDIESYKIRKGKVGGYVDYLAEEDIDWMNTYIDETLSDMFAFYKTKQPG